MYQIFKKILWDRANITEAAERIIIIIIKTTKYAQDILPLFVGIQNAEITVIFNILNL